MIKLIFYIIGSLLFIHFVLYYCNIDLFDLYKNKKCESENNSKEVMIDDSKINEISINEKEIKDIRNILEESLNELKQYDNNNNNNHESIESLD